MSSTDSKVPDPGRQSRRAGPARTAPAGPDRVCLFVNGTLMRGGPLHPNLAGAVFRGPARTLPRYRLLSVRDPYGGWREYLSRTLPAGSATSPGDRQGSSSPRAGRGDDVSAPGAG